MLVQSLGAFFWQIVSGLPKSIGLPPSPYCIRRVSGLTDYIITKIERIEDNSDRERIKKELSEYREAIFEYVREGKCSPEQIEQWHKELYEANGKTWDLEARIRKGQLENLEDIIVLAEIGRTAVKIRESNGIRVGIKSKIVEATGIGYRDIKINHASQDTLKDYKSKP